MNKKLIKVSNALLLTEFKHIFRVMKLTSLFGILCVSSAFAVNVNSQSLRVNIQANQKQAKEVIKQIEEQTDYLFVYNHDKVNLNNTVTIQANNETVAEVLNQMFAGTDIIYAMQGNNILLMQKDAVVQQSGKVVTGTIVDPSGMPVIGANVMVKGSTNGTITDMDGKFSLEVEEGATLQISYIGYANQEIKVGNQKTLSIALKEDAEALDELVVVGYGTQKKVNLTGSVAVIDNSKIRDKASTNLSQAIQGIAPGVNFSYGNSGFEPGAKLDLQIRGQGSPYVVIDGVAGELNDINPNDIESISILKDAAASAIYGARAPYGVVLITTKSGKKDEKIQVDFSANMSLTTPIRLPKMVDSYTFVRAMNEMHDNQGVSRLYDEETIDRIIAYINDPTLPETVPDSSNPTQWATYLKSNGNNDWIDIYMGQGLRNQENISVKGGGENINFFVSAGHVYEDGILNFGTDNYRRFNINSKLNIDLTKWWKFESNTRFVQSERVRPNYDDEGDYDMMLHQIYRTQPQQYLKSPNGYYSRLSRIPMVESGTDKTIGRSILQRFAMQFNPIEKWKINLDYSIDFSYDSFVSENLTAYEDLVDGSMSAIPTTVPSYVEKTKSHTAYNSFNIYTSYDFTIGNFHNLGILAGFQQEFNKYDYLYGKKKELIINNLPSISTAIGEMQAKDDMSHWATEGFFARITYDYKEKYLLEVNARYDGTSRFASGHRWGLFPSLSLAWNLSHEKFWEKIIPIINQMKLRGSWGSLGNQNVANYQYLALVGTNTQLAWILNANRPAYTTAPNLINPELTWETSNTYDVGIDMGLLNNRLQFTYDYYRRLTFNRLGPAMALPAVIGASIPQENNSELKTYGWDLSISWRDKINSDFSYSVTAMLYDYHSIVSKYNNPTGILTTDYEGKTLGEIWGYETVGLIQTQEEADFINQNGTQKFINGQVWKKGDVMYKDINGDGKIDKGENTIDNHGDIKIIGNSTPRYQFSLDLAATYKNFDINAFFQGVGKRDFWLSGNMFWGFNAWNFTTLFPHHLDYYRDVEGTKYSGLGINYDSYYPRPYSDTSQDSKNKQVQTRYLQSGAYLRLKNLSVGYNLPKLLISRIGLQKVRLYVSGENLFTITSLPIGFDPETANLGTHGSGKSIFSQAVYSFGVNITF